VSEGNGSYGSPATSVSAMDGAHPIHPERGPVHTPGPWAVVESGFGETVYLVCRDIPGRLHPVCTMEQGSARAEDDARLIARAPDLLQELRDLVDTARRYRDGDGSEETMNLCIESAEQLIAQAAGQ